MCVPFVYRSNIQCDYGKILHYSYSAHTLESSTPCFGPNMCIDYIELLFPTYNAAPRTCGTLSSLRQLIGFDGMKALEVTIATNREFQFPGLFLFVYCVSPGFDQNAMPGNMIKRNVADRSNCTSPNGIGPRDEPQFPPPVCGTTTPFTSILFPFFLPFLSPPPFH